MPDADELDLFPELRNVLSSWGKASTPTLPMDEHGGVTDEAVAEYVRSRMMNGQRPAPLAPVQQTPSGQLAGPMFAPGTTGTPPPPSHVEGGGPSPLGTPDPVPVVTNNDGGDGGEDGEDDGDTGSDDLGSATSQDGESADGLTAPPAAPPIDANELVVLPDGRTLPKRAVTAYADLHDVMQQDPRFRDFIAQYLATGQIPVAPAPPTPVAGPTAQPTAQPQPASPVATTPLPPLPEEYADDPGFRAIYEAQQRTQAQIDALVRAQQAQIQTSVEQQQRQFNTAVVKAKNDFKSRYELSDDDVEKLDGIAARMNVLPSFLRGIHPVDNTPWNPEPVSSVMAALDLAYHATPEYREREFARLQEARKQDAARKRKLGAVGGTSGSVPRSTPAPTTQAGQRQAMTQEIADMLAGTWVNPSGN